MKTIQCAHDIYIYIYIYIYVYNYIPLNSGELSDHATTRKQRIALEPVKRY